MMRRYRHYDSIVATRNGMIQFQDVSGSHGDRMVKAVDGGQLPSAMRSALLQQNLLNVSMHTCERKEYLQAVQTVFKNAGIKFDPRCWKSIVWITDDERWQLHRVWGINGGSSIIKQTAAPLLGCVCLQPAIAQ